MGCGLTWRLRCASVSLAGNQWATLWSLMLVSWDDLTSIWKAASSVTSKRSLRMLRLADHVAGLESLVEAGGAVGAVEQGGGLQAEQAGGQAGVVVEDVGTRQLEVERRAPAVGDRQRDRQHRPDTELDRTRGEPRPPLPSGPPRSWATKMPLGGGSFAAHYVYVGAGHHRRPSSSQSPVVCPTTRVAAPRAVRSSPSRADRAAVVGGETSNYACHWPRPRDRSAEVTLPAGPRSAGRLPPCPGAHRRLRE